MAGGRGPTPARAWRDVPVATAVVVAVEIARHVGRVDADARRAGREDPQRRPRSGEGTVVRPEPPLLAARGSPVPSIIWHGPLDDEWHVIVQRRLPGRSLRSLTWPLLDQVVKLVELQADACALPTSEDRDFTGYIAHVLFDDWDDLWRDASSAGPHAEALCARLRERLPPAWGLRLPACDFTNNDLNLSNILSDGQHITGIVDWDEFGVGSRALDLVVLAFDCTRDGAVEMADRLLARATKIVGDEGLRCLVSYRAIAMLAEDAREHLDSHSDTTTIERILDRLDGP